MRPTATDGASVACRSVSVTNESLAKVAEAEPIVMPFRMLTREGPRMHVSDGGPDPDT